MSEVLDLAERLRAVSDDELAHILRQRLANPNAIRDFFDLAEQLLQPRNLENWVSSLSRDALQKLSAGAESTDPLIEFLSKRKFAFAGFAQALGVGLSQRPAGLEASAGIHAFEATLVITELVYELEQRMMREMGKSGIGLPDVKRLAALTGKDFGYIRCVFDLARAADLITAREDRWRLTAKAAAWSAGTIEERLALLANTWRELLGTYATKAVAVRLSNGENFDAALRDEFPLEKFSETSRYGRALAFAELLGFSVNGFSLPWTSDLLDGSTNKAVALLAAHVPAPTDRIIVQADLSIIAPGPLSAAVERSLRAFVETEQSSLASRYRITALSVSHALESGLNIEQVRSTLEKLSGAKLPQPVEYLLNDAVKRFGRIRILDDESTGGCHIRAQESTLLTELVNDTRLRPYALVRLDSETLASRFSGEIVYYGLREVGIAAIRVTKSGSVLSPTRFISVDAESVSGDSIAELIARLRETDARLGSSADDDAVLRQITLAIKTKAQLEVTFVGQDEQERILLLEPTGVANGRMRARDRKADIERTLPLENITAVRLV